MGFNLYNLCVVHDAVLCILCKLQCPTFKNNKKYQTWHLLKKVTALNNLSDSNLDPHTASCALTHPSVA